PAADEDSVRATLRRIASIVKLDSLAIERLLIKYRRTPYLPVTVRPSATFEVVSALEERRLIFPGLLIQPEPKRHYPDSSLVAHLVGYVGELTEAERAQRRFASIRLGGILGKGGLEREYDDTLRGADGVRFVEVSALGHVVREGGAGSRLAPVPGRALHTTIDLDLQRYIAQIFPAGHRGAVLAMNPNTGEILALFSAPGFDPNAFVGGVDPEYWRRLSENAAHPLFDRTIQARYPPGSTWKLAIAAMALKRGIVTLRSRMPIPCRGGLQYGNRFFRCWSARGHGDLALADAIAQSCDVYFYQLGLKLGLTSMLEDANGLGFRSRTGIDLPGEIASEFPTGTDYYDRTYGPRRWTSAGAQNPHGPAHGWFIGFAPADKPEIVVGAIVEFAREGPYVAPLVTRVIGHYLGVDTTVASHVRIVLPNDTAPHPMQLLPALPGDDSTVTPLVPFDTTTPDTTDMTAPADSNPPPPPPPADAPRAPRDR